MRSRAPRASGPAVFWLLLLLLPPQLLSSGHRPHCDWGGRSALPEKGEQKESCNSEFDLYFFLDVSAMRIASEVDHHLMLGTEESRLEPVTQLFRNTKKIRLEDTNQGVFTRSKEIGMGSLSAKALGSVTYVKESDGIEMTDVE